MTATRNRTDGDLPQPSRRRFVAAAGSGIGLALTGWIARGEQPAAERPPRRERVLQRGQRIELEGDAQQIVAAAYRLGHDYEKRHGGCAQCTVAALQDAVPFVPRRRGLFRAASCLDGGATPGGTQNCGGFNGAGMVIGQLCGRSRDGDTFRGDKSLAQQLLRKVYAHFEREYGTVLCQDVRRGVDGDCPLAVGRAAQWTAEALLEEFTDYRPPAPAEPEKPEESPAAETQS